MNVDAVHRRWLPIDRHLVVVDGDEVLLDLLGLRDELIRSQPANEVSEAISKLDGQVVEDLDAADRPEMLALGGITEDELASGYIRDPLTGGWRPTPETVT